MSKMGELAVAAIAAEHQPPIDVATGSGWEGDIAADWGAVDLYQAFKDLESLRAPDQLARTDGASLLRRGDIASLIGESGSGKTWVSAALGLQEVRRGEAAAIFDFESTAHAYLARLLSAGYTRVEIVSAIRYFSPYSQFGALPLQRVLADLETSPAPSLVVIDAATEAAAIAIPGASSNSNDDWARFMNVFVRPLRDQTGATILLLDHPVKDKDSRRGYASGTQHKRASVDVAFGLETTKTFGRGESGEALLKVFKDRSGYLRGMANDSDVVGVVKFACRPNGDLTVTIDPPAERQGAFRPSHLMEHASRHLESNPAQSVRQIRAAVPGNATAVGEAIQVLIREGFVTVEQQGRANIHKSVRPYREANDG